MTDTETKAEGLQFKLEFFLPPAVAKYRTFVKSASGKILFEQNGCSFPTNYSINARNIIASKYFYGDQAQGVRESKMSQLVERVTSAITQAGQSRNYFASDVDALHFQQSLTYICTSQRAAFNSPVWFNVGVWEAYKVDGGVSNYVYDPKLRQSMLCTNSLARPQASACFIQGIEDDMGSIMDLARSEAMLFKYGSGTGTDLTKLRSKREKLTGGGAPSGPVSFLKLYDTIAGMIKSGGKTRRAARMQTLKCHHPDILEFIQCKRDEERKAVSLIAAGYDGSMDGPAYGTVAFQNTNITVRVSDLFMEAVEKDLDWQTIPVRPDKATNPMPCYKARFLMDEIGSCAHECADPGIQYEDTIQRWHTCPNTAPINSSNPCSEYLFIDDSACNLASLNLVKYWDPTTRRFLVEEFCQDCRTMLVAMDILVSHASYPTPKIAENSYKFRPLGLGFANLGALLMQVGLPYDSDDGRNFAAMLTALMHGAAYRASGEMAQQLGAFEGWADNREPMLRVIHQHEDAALGLVNAKQASLASYGNLVTNLDEILSSIEVIYDNVVTCAQNHGFRNSQVTVLAPTGTIGFMMDCDTTGVEPDFALVKYKEMAGGGAMKIVNGSVRLALEGLKYDEEKIARILEYIEREETHDGCPDLRNHHLAIFDCAVPPMSKPNSRFIAPMGHVRMMGALQPFISGAISKTVNVPRETTPQQMVEIYMEGWKLGLKALSVYRDGAKSGQPLTAGTAKKEETTPAAVPAASGLPVRRKLPNVVPSMRYKIQIGGHKGYMTVGHYADGTPGELFITMSKEGSTAAGLMDTIATLVSILLQYGIPLQPLVDKFSFCRFEPAGLTYDTDVPQASSIVDYIFRKLAALYLQRPQEPVTPPPLPLGTPLPVMSPPQAGEVLCAGCGAIMLRRAGSCYYCDNCGSSSGSCG